MELCTNCGEDYAACDCCPCDVCGKQFDISSGDILCEECSLKEPCRNCGNDRPECNCCSKCGRINYACNCVPWMPHRMCERCGISYSACDCHPCRICEKLVDITEFGTDLCQEHL